MKLMGIGKLLRVFIGESDRLHHQPLYEAIVLKARELHMSTGLTFGTISALFGLSHRIITQRQYSVLVATVIASAVVPTLIANAFFFPHHLLPEPKKAAHTSTEPHQEAP